MDQYEKRLAQKLAKLSKEVRKAYLDAIKAISKLGVQMSLDAQGEFYFSANPAIKKKVDKIIEKLYFDVYGVTVSGINSAWDLAVEKNNAIAGLVFGKALEKLPKAYRSKILSTNALARQKFVERRINGLGLSDRIWKNTQQFREELELSLELGIGKGKSASSLATEIKQYLNDPDKLFRRVRDKKTGKLRLSKAARAYHPGQGRYRSSYQNAFRLTRNETNFSYEGSNHEKHKDQDFVVGIEIKVSPQHKRSDDKGGIQCFELQGKYPKSFDFTYKWHVNCKCTTFTVLKTREEVLQDVKKIMSGGSPTTESENEVKKIPEHFTSYVQENEKKWANWKNKPRFLKNIKN